jgi:hypothetical protein
METVHGLPSEQSELLGVVRGVRNRYRAKRALRGAAITVGGGWLVLAAAAYTMNFFKYSDASVLTCRIVALVALVAIAVWFIVLPLLPRLRDEQVALYLEEHERSLKATVITAVEMQTSGPAGAVSSLRSPAFIQRLTRAALERVHTVADGRTIDAGELRTNGGIFAAIALAALLVTMFGPPVLRHGVRLVTTPWNNSEPASLFSILVEPGNVTVAKGGDELLEARLRGFQSDNVELLVRGADSANWARLPMTPDSSGRFAYRLFDIGGKMQYAVEANGVRSTTYTIDVSNLPYVKQMDLEYRYPAYTQLEPLDVDSTGDIAALKGTTVRIRVSPTVPTNGGRVVVDGGDTLRLVPTSNGQLMAMLRVENPGFYKIELEGPQGKMVTGSLDYTIDVLPDRPPTVQFTKPGRDQKVLSVDEVYTEARAEDDYGVAKLELVYSVNGAAERVMPLHEGTRAIKDVAAGYTFMLEGLKLEPGDVVSYYARATDNNAVSGPQHASTDIYFMQVRPYENDYRQQQGGGGGGGGGGQQNDAGQLSQKQRDIIAATFKTSRDSALTDKKSLQENLATLRLSQQRLKEQTNQLVDKLVQRGIAKSDSNWKKISDILPKAAAAMDTAEKKLSDGSPQAALQPEQRALQQLQRAEAVFHEIQVSMGGGGGGGGGGNKTDAQDLADIFELQKDRLRNQYETVQRGQQQDQQQQANNQVDETLEKLRQLAARQQQENDRARAKADSLSRMGASGASGGQGQRDLAQQAEAQAHQLERLAREQQNQSLADAARRLQDAADAMRRAAANGQKSGDASQALNNLQDARRLLDQEKSGRSSRDVSDAVRAAQQLADQEKGVQSDVQKLGQSADPSAQQQLKQSIAQQKGAMADGVKDLKSKLDRMALDNKREQRDVSRALESAADTLRGRKVEEKLRYTQQQTRTAPADWMNSAEQQIGADIADLGQRLQQAQTAAQSGNGQRQQAQTADRARDLVRGLESMDERMRQKQEQAANGAQRRLAEGGDQQGKQGQGQTAQEGRQGQQSQQAQSGQRGQNGQQQNQQSAGQGQQQAQGQQGQGQQGQGQAKGQQGNGQQGQQGQGSGQGQQQSQANGQGQRQGQGRGNGQQMGNGGAPSGAGSPRGGNPQFNGGRLSPEDAQQFSREAQQRLNDAEALRRDLAKQGLPTTELDRAIEGLRQLADARVLEDTRTAADLRSKTIEGFKDFEFGLRRRLGEGDSTRVLLERSGDVPPAYKQHVEEYYRSIGRAKPSKP